MRSSNFVNSPTCFGTPHVPSSGCPRSGYRKAFERSVEQEENEFTVMQSQTSKIPGETHFKWNFRMCESA